MHSVAKRIYNSIYMKCFKVDELVHVWYGDHDKLFNAAGSVHWGRIIKLVEKIGILFLCIKAIDAFLIEIQRTTRSKDILYFCTDIGNRGVHCF